VNLNNGGRFALVWCGNTAQSGRGKYSVIRGLPVGIETDVAVPPTPLERGARSRGPCTVGETVTSVLRVFFA